MFNDYSHRVLHTYSEQRREREKKSYWELCLWHFLSHFNINWVDDFYMCAVFIFAFSCEIRKTFISFKQSLMNILWKLKTFTCILLCVIWWNQCDNIYSIAVKKIDNKFFLFFLIQNESDTKYVTFIIIEPIDLQKCPYIYLFFTFCRLTLHSHDMNTHTHEDIRNCNERK